MACNNYPLEIYITGQWWIEPETPCLVVRLKQAVVDMKHSSSLIALYTSCRGCCRGIRKLLLTTYRKMDPIGGPTLTYCGCCQGIRKSLLTTYRKIDPIGGPTITYCGCCQGNRKILWTTYQLVYLTWFIVGVVRGLGKFYWSHIGKWTWLEELPWLIVRLSGD